MATQSPDNALPPAYRLGEYIIESVLGHGGFGITYLARDTKLSSRVAIKEYFPQAFAIRDSQSTIVPRPEGTDTYQWGLREFLKEGRALAKFKHNHIVRVLRFLEANGTAYMVMEYEEGESLAHYLRRSGGFLNESMLLSVFLPILGGLQAVHDAGLLHLDIKPENIYLRNNGQPMLIDFGSARQAKSRDAKDQNITLTPAYAALEHYPDHGKQGPWTDVYSIGATLYRCVTGKIPVDAMDRYKLLREKKRDPLAHATAYERPLYTSYIRESVDWAMKLSPKERPHTALALQRALMGHGMSNDIPTAQSSVNYKSGYIGIAKVVRPEDLPIEIKQGVLGKVLVGMLLLIAAGIFTLKYLLENEFVTEAQVYENVAYVENVIKDVMNPGPRARESAPAARSQPRTGTPAAHTRPSNPARRKHNAPFDAAKVLVKNLSGHGDWVQSLAFLQDGRMLASASTDGVVKLWNLETGNVEHTFSSNNDMGSTVAVSPDGSWLATTADNNTIRLWNVRTNSLESQLEGHSGGINDMAFSPDSKILASTSMDQSLILWDVKAKGIARHISGYKHNVLTVAFAPNGRRLATGDASGEIRYWQTSTGNLAGYFQAHDGKITSIAFSPDGRWLASGGTDQFLKLWDTGLKRDDRTFSGAPKTVYTVTFSPDSRWLIVGGTGDAIQIWSIASGELVHQLFGHNTNTFAVALSPDGSLLAAGGDDETVRLWR